MQPASISPMTFWMTPSLLLWFQISVYAMPPTILSNARTTVSKTSQLSAAGSATCFSDPKWLPPPHQAWTPQYDCIHAVSEFRREAWFGDLSNTIEVFDARSRPSTVPIYHLDTPAKWSSMRGSTCTLTVAMLNHFNAWDIPGIAGSGAGVDVSDMVLNGELFEAVQGLFRDCAMTRRAGWAYAGETNSIGVFFWATGSQIDQETRSVRFVSSNVTSTS